MLNKVIIGGRLTREPEATVTTSGTDVSKFTVAIPRRFNRDETDFLNVVAFGKTAEFTQKWFTRGSSIIVVGSIQSRSYEKDGQKRYVTEIIAEEVNFAGSKKDNQETTETVSDDDAMKTLESLRDHNGFAPVDDDSLPF